MLENEMLYGQDRLDNDSIGVDKVAVRSDGAEQLQVIEMNMYKTLV